MNPRKQYHKAFRLIGNQYNHYFDHDQFMGRDVFSSFWDSKNRTPIIINQDTQKVIRVVK